MDPNPPPEHEPHAVVSGEGALAGNGEPREAGASGERDYPEASRVGTARLATIRGVPIRIHFSVVIALPFFAWLASTRMRAPVTLATLGGGGPLAEPWTWACLLTIGLFATVLLHETAHVLAALAV